MDSSPLQPIKDPDTGAASAKPAEDKTSTVSAQPPPERYFDRYRVEGELGRGGMGIVLLARDEELNKQVALKLLPIEVACDIDAISDLKKEVLRGMALLHPGIVRVFNFERDVRGVAIVMEYVPGETLTDRRRREPGECFDCEDILPWIEELCEILDYAHTQAQIAHRDLKPRNIIVTPDGRVKVADFGLAAGLCGSLSRTSIQGEPAGTPPYMSPQQIRGETPTHFDDIYALGATIYELLTGKPPFYRGNILAQVLQATAVTMEQRRAERGIGGKARIPPAWEQAVAACLAKDPAGRPPSAKALRDWLHDANSVPMSDTMVRIVRPQRALTEPLASINPVSSIARPETAPVLKLLPSVPTQRGEPACPTRSSVEPSPWPGLLRQAAVVLFAAALTAGGAHALRHRKTSRTLDNPPSAAAAPAKVERPSPLGGSALQPAPAISPTRLDEPRPPKVR